MVSGGITLECDQSFGSSACLPLPVFLLAQLLFTIALGFDVSMNGGRGAA